MNRKYTQMNANLRLEGAEVTERFSRKRRATIGFGIGRTYFFARVLCVHSRSFAVSIKNSGLIESATTGLPIGSGQFLFAALNAPAVHFGTLQVQ
ncbi:MAG: hypothetical protein RQ729_12125 [Wenzhouxiangellaceae bacterium]|nr:hypothetical protein [Wenzhouxiangellaceae bacterium]